VNFSPLHQDVVFHGPLTEERAAAIISSLGPLDGQRVLDLGCGWAELLLRTIASSPTATGVGVDLKEIDVEHGRANAARRGLSDRVDLRVGDASTWSGGPVDVVFNTGASHVWGGDPVVHTVNALKNVRALLEPGGRFVFAECFWIREPTEDELAIIPMPRDQYGSLADLVDLAHEHGFRLLALSESSTDEWDHFQFQHALAWERWLLANPDSPDAPEVRAKSDAERTGYLRGWRGVLGYVHLTLVATT
jgi:SAM-dependent methyltransferase